jgi:predicted permease
MIAGPPPFLRRILSWILPPGPIQDGLLGDLDELYRERARSGRLRANAWYAVQLASAAVHYPLWGASGRSAGGGPRTVEGLGSDARYVLRTLRASPGFAIATVATLGLGIGATLVLDGYGRASRPGPAGIASPERLLHLGEGPPGCVGCVSMGSGAYGIVQDEARSFERVSRFAEWEPTLRGTSGGALLDGLQVSPEIFETLGVRPLLGRLFVAGDGEPGGEHVVVLGEATWRSRFGVDSTVIGQSVILDRVPYSIVGVVSDRFVFPDAVDRTEVWAPLAGNAAAASDESGIEYRVVARLREGATAASASVELAGLAARSAPSGGSREDATYLVSPVLEESGLVNAPTLLVVAVWVVLLISWINLAGLVVARLSARRSELAVRRALGATSSHIVRHLLVEATVLAVLGGLLGTAVAVAGTRAVLGTAQPVDLRTLRLVLVLGGLSSVVVGAWPALRYARPRRGHVLADGTRTTTGGIDSSRGRRALMVAEIACATVLLSATGLLARTFANIYRIEPGFDIEGVLAIRIWNPPAGYGDGLSAERIDELVRALGTLPGVVQAGAVLGLPFGHGAPQRAFEIGGRAASNSADRPRARMQAATPGYFGTLRIPVRRGRGFDDADGADAPAVAVLNEAAASAFFRAADPVGRSVVIDGVRSEIVGVVGTVFDGDQENPAIPEIYRPMRQWPHSSTWIALRIREAPMRTGADVRAAVRAFDADIAVTRLLDMEALRAESMSSERAMLRLMAGFALAAVLISAVGLYGLVSYSVSQRVREFGIRVALGAPRGAVLGLVVGEGVRLAATGAAIGLVGAVATLRVMRSMLFGVSATDPVTLAVVVALVCGVALLAAVIPARRAMRTDPSISLNDV